MRPGFIPRLQLRVFQIRLRGTADHARERREFSRWTDAAVAAALILGSVIGAMALDIAIGWPVSLVGVAVHACFVFLAAAFVFGFIYPTLSRVLPDGTLLDDYIARFDEGRPWGLAQVAVFVMGLGAIASLFALAVGFGIVLSLFWVVPTVIWLSVFHDVSVVDAGSYALFVSQGRPEYEGPGGVNTDPATMGFFLFTLVGWAVILAAIALAVSPIAVLWYLRHRRNEALWWEKFRREHGME
jgi:hypothetical protein